MRSLALAFALVLAACSSSDSVSDSSSAVSLTVGDYSCRHVEREAGCSWAECPWWGAEQCLSRGFSRWCEDWALDELDEHCDGLPADWWRACTEACE